MELVDTHAHLDQHTFDSDRAQIIEQAAAVGVNTIVTIGTTAATSVAAVALAGQFQGVFAAVGIQPNDSHQAAPDDWQQVVKLTSQPRVVALGETGLDRYWDDAPFDVQQDYFDRHLRLSQRLDLPLVIHMRESEADVLTMLREARQRGELCGVMHSYTGTAEGAAEFVELGFWISFAGMVTFKNSVALRAVAACVPADRIVVETDSPYLSPQPLRGKRNQPANVVHTAQCLAELRGQPLESFAAQTTANACRLFRRIG